MFKVRKREGKIASFDIKKITDAITKAFEAENAAYDENIIDFLALKVTADFESKVVDNIINVEDIQDSVESVLIQAGYSEVAKRYIIYLNNNHKIAKTIDKIYKDPNLAENDIECQKYKKLLDNPETCPKNIWDAANTNKWMSVAGVFMLIHSAFMALYYINYLINDHNFLSIHFTEIYSNLSDGVYYVFRSGSESLRNFAQYAIWLDTHINTFNKDLLRNAQVLNPLCHIVVYTVSIYAAIAYLKRNKMIGAKLHLFSILLDSVFTIILTGSNSTLIMYLFRDNAYFIILKILIQVILCSYICKDQKDRIPDIATCIYACVYLLPIISSVAGVIYRNDSIIFLVLDIITSLAAFLSYIFIIMGRRVYHNKTESK